MINIQIKKIAVCMLAVCASLTADANGSYWTNMEGTRAPSLGERGIIPEKYSLLQINPSDLKNILYAAPLKADDNYTIELPTPGGGSRVFKIWNTPMFPAALQAKFPEITTYTATSIDEPGVSAKIDYTTKGFHVMVFDGGNTYFVDPYSKIDDGYYIVYYKKDYRRDVGDMMHCEFENDISPLPGGGKKINVGNGIPSVEMKTNGATKRTYRLALSCTGEYAIAVDGSSPTTAGVLSAMTTSMNRVNGIYEREMAVTMEFISEEESLIYLNPSTDPFTANNNGGALLNQNQNNTNAEVGSSYDIGHIFSTGGGGIAQLGCVCSNSSKAMGVTGSPYPVGDAYDVDYVAHEMGHQFGGNHTFNACSGTENEETSYEPGSGSTILAYAGICGATNNLQNNSDDYFHAVTLLEMNYFVETGFWGGGGAGCGTSAASGVTVPTVDFAAASYNIPYQTPFELTSPIASPAGALTYCWEQWDNGGVNFQQNESSGAGFTEGPQLRSFDPVAHETRIFPTISRILANIDNPSYKGERLSTIARTSHFSLVVRNISNGWGAFNSPDPLITLNIANTGAPFKVTSPSTVVSWTTGSQQTISWDVAQTNIAPVNCATVDVYFSADGGTTFPYLAASGIPNTGSATITVPTSFNSNEARIKVKGSNNVFFNINSSDFTVSGPITGINDVELESGISIYPNPAQDQLVIGYNNPASKLEVAIYNAIGQRVFQADMKDQLSLNVSKYARGVYFVHVADEGKNAKAVKSITLR